jgi:hypothetical protein
VDRFGIIKKDAAPKELSARLQKELGWVRGHNAAAPVPVVPKHVSDKADKCVMIAQKLISKELVEYDRHVVACGGELMKYSDDMVNSMYAWITEPLKKIKPHGRTGHIVVLGTDKRGRPKPTAAVF